MSIVTVTGVTVSLQPACELCVPCYRNRCLPVVNVTTALAANSCCLSCEMWIALKCWSSAIQSIQKTVIQDAYNRIASQDVMHVPG